MWDQNENDLDTSPKSTHEFEIYSNKQTHTYTQAHSENSNVNQE